MVEVKQRTRIDMPRRERIAQERMQMLRSKKRGIRVLPKDDDVRRYIKHMPSGIAFRSEGSIEWPDDVFTRRRLADGTVTRVEEKGKSEQRPREARHTPREGNE
jgi:hypothetical protein